MELYNSFSKSKEQFIPLKEKQIKMYVCGQTVYDYCHMGHARKAVVFDVIRRYFIACGYSVTFVENITDIDDKIITRAKENNESIADLTHRFINYMHEDFDRLGIMRADIQPKATEYIAEMLAIIKDLLAKGYAYQADNGDIYYAVRKFSAYGKLSGRNLDELNAGERVDIDHSKRDPLDFVLWKSAKIDEPYWDSEFGKGRPGWHIECSAMAEKLLGSSFDIHGGGQDLQFPHHENEIAQSQGHGCKFANYWLHNGFLNIDNEKMSKSLGNFFILRDVLKVYDAEVIRLFMLKTHYRSPLNFSHHGLIEAKAGLTRLYTCLRAFKGCHSDKVDWDSSSYTKRVKTAMDDDFNTPLAIGVLFDLCNQINISQDKALAVTLISLANSMGFLNYEPEQFLQQGSKLSVDIIEELIDKRHKAKQAKDFITADKIRTDLLQEGILLEDSADKTTWRKC